MDKFMKNVALYLLIIFVAISAIDFFSQQQQPKVQEMHYTDFMKQVEDGQVSKVVLVENVIKGTLSDGTEFKSVMPGFPYQEDNLVDKLQAKNIDIKAENPPEPPWWSSLISSLLPIVGSPVVLLYESDSGWRRQDDVLWPQSCQG